MGTIKKIAPSPKLLRKSRIHSGEVAAALFTRPDFNPRFVAYAKSFGNSPMEQLLRDEVKWPGGIMCGFILWIADKKRKFCAMNPDAHLFGNIVDQKAWDKFLSA